MRIVRRGCEKLLVVISLVIRFKCSSVFPHCSLKKSLTGHRGEPSGDREASRSVVRVVGEYTGEEKRVCHDDSAELCLQRCGFLLVHVVALLAWRLLCDLGNHWAGEVRELIRQCRGLERIVGTITAKSSCTKLQQLCVDTLISCCEDGTSARVSCTTS